MEIQDYNTDDIENTDNQDNQQLDVRGIQEMLNSLNEKVSTLHSLMSSQKDDNEETFDIDSMFENDDNIPFNWEAHTNYLDSKEKFKKDDIENKMSSLFNTNGKSIAESHNNPGNLKYADWMKKYGAYEGSNATDGGKFAVFPDMQTGMKAREDLLKSSFYNNKSVDEAMKVYSNNGYNGNIYPEIKNKKMGELSDEERNRLTALQFQHEDSGLAHKLGYFQYGGINNLKYTV